MWLIKLIIFPHLECLTRVEINNSTQQSSHLSLQLIHVHFIKLQEFTCSTTQYEWTLLIHLACNTALY